jgi:hypothetical protein
MPSLDERVKTLLAPHIAGPPGASAYELVETLLAAWQEMHRDRAIIMRVLGEMHAAIATIESLAAE